MRDQPFHPQRHALVEHISDDVRALHQDSAEQQKVLFSGRALADMLAGDTFDSTRATDAKYFTSGKVDFNKVTDACIRYVTADSYSNGPENISYSGFIHTQFVLPSGTLTYSADGLATRGGNPVSARQILYPDDSIEFEAYTRVGKYASGAWTWTEWVTLSGRMLRILITEQDDEALEHLRPNVIYELHMGGVKITLPSADAYPAATRIIFEQYHNGEATFTRANTTGATPSPNVRYFTKSIVTDPNTNLQKSVYTAAGSNHGWLTEFEADTEYYIQIGQASWTNIIEYTENVVGEDNTVESKTYTTQTVPALDTIRTSSTTINSGTWYENSEQAVVYAFEIVDREESVTSGSTTSTRTWMLDVDPEAVSRMSDMAELLDQHTDPMMTDMVQYSLRKFKGTGGNSGDISGDYLEYIPNNSDPLVVSRPASMNGYVKFTITGNTNKNDGTNTWNRQLSSSFKVAIYVYNEASASFNWQTAFTYSKVNKTTTPTPNQYRQYYIIDENTMEYKLAGAQGYVSTFETDTDYYTREVTDVLKGASLAKFKASIDGAAEKEYDAQFLDAGSTADTFQREAYFSTHDELVGYLKAARNDTIMVVITSGDHVTDMGLVTPVVEFYPDPHDSYVLKPQVSSEPAITTEELAKVPRPESETNLIARADAVVRAYELLAKTLQEKGILFGALPVGSDTEVSESKVVNLDELTAQGIYTLNVAKTNLTMSSEFTASTLDYDDAASMTRNSCNPRYSFDNPLTGSDRVSNAVVVVMRSESFAKDVILEPDSTEDKSDTGFVRITQLMFGNAGTRSSDVKDTMRSAIWTRFGVQVSGEAAIKWSNWVQFQNSMITYEANDNTDITESEVVKALSYGSPNLVVKRPSSSTTDAYLTVTLPDPALYPNAKLKVEAINTAVKITYTKSSTSGSTTFEFTKSVRTTAPNHALYPIESDGAYWYIVTVS